MRPTKNRSCIAFIIVIAASVMALSSCDIFGGIAAPQTSTAPLVRFVEPVNGKIDLSLYASEAGRSAYVVFTTGTKNNLDPPEAQSKDISGSVTRVTADGRDDTNFDISERLRALARDAAAQATPSIQPRLSSTGDASADKLGDAQTFYVIPDADTEIFTSVPATCKLVRASTNFGTRTRTLSVWVANDCWDPASSKKHAITQNMVDALAAKFFGEVATPTESIYAWVTNMLGDEWGNHSATTVISGDRLNLIEPSGNVTILLADICSDADVGDTKGDNGGIVGYFYPADTIEGGDNSNERIMFTIDAQMYANPDDNGYSEDTTAYYVDNGWLPTDYWATEVFSTLAHEFQHMIHFYQKGVVRGGDYFNEPTWIDELCAMQVEDLLADKLGVPGPRGVSSSVFDAGSAGNTSGRLPDFILYPDVSLSNWGSVSQLASYSIAYSFGAYLTRNYGGAECIRSVVQSAAADAGVIASAAAIASGKAESMEGLLRKWGAAVLLSGRTDAPEFYRYNTGGAFTSSVGSSEYKLGSINMYNYLYPNGLDTNGDEAGDTDQSGPYVYDSDGITKIYGGAYSDAFMDLGTPSSRPSWTITVPAGMYATIVID